MGLISSTRSTYMSTIETNKYLIPLHMCTLLYCFFPTNFLSSFSFILQKEFAVNIYFNPMPADFSYAS